MKAEISRQTHSVKALSYRVPELGDEHQISVCIRASENMHEMTDGTHDSISEWEKMSGSEELRRRILSEEKSLVAMQGEVVVGFIAFDRGTHLSLLFVRRDWASKGIGRELFTRCIDGLDQITVRASDSAIGFYQRVGFVQTGERFFKYGAWMTPMKWVRNNTQVNLTISEIGG